MRFTVTYWEHRQLSAVAEQEEVEAALQAYAQQNPHGRVGDRARAALAQLAGGAAPDDMGIIEFALREATFQAPKGTEPDRVDETTDYIVTVRG